jgi:hypothetical protein
VGHVSTDQPHSQENTPRLNGQAKDGAGPTCRADTDDTPAVYRIKVERTQEAPGLLTGARRVADTPHGALNYPIYRHKDARRVFFLV